MACLFAHDCGARHSSTQLRSGRGFTSVSNYTQVQFVANAGRGGNTPVIAINGGNSNGYMRNCMKKFSANDVAEVYFFARISQGATNPSATLAHIWKLTNNAGSTICELRAPAANPKGLDLYLESTLVQTAAVTTSNTQQVIEIRVKPAGGGAGVLEMRVDGVSVYSNTSATFTNTTGVNCLWISGFHGGTDTYWQDLEIHTPTGNPPNSWLGPSFYIYTDFPNANGNQNQFTPTAGANYTNVSEVNSDDGTSVVTSATVGNVELYSFPALPSSVTTVHGVIVVPVAQPTDSGGSAYLKTVVRKSSTDYETGTSGLVPGAWNDIPLTCIDADPSTGSPWASPAAVNGSQFGIKHTSS